MPWSKHKNNWHSTQFECDMDDARAEAELAAARSGRHRPGTVEVVIEEEDFFGNTTTTRRRTDRYGTTTTTTSVERHRQPAPRPMSDDEVALAVAPTAATVAVVALGALFGGRD